MEPLSVDAEVETQVGAFSTCNDCWGGAEKISVLFIACPEKSSGFPLGGQQVRGWGHLLSAPGSPQEVKNFKKTSLLVLASFIASLNQYQISCLASQQVACSSSLPVLSAGGAESYGG